MANNDTPHALPSDLEQFILEAPQTLRGGFRSTVTLVRYPIRVKDDESEKEIRSTWITWWEKSSWATGNPTHRVRWNSNVRTGLIWRHFGEAAHLIDGQPSVFCLNCGLALQHPNSRAIGTKHLLNHMDSRACKNTSAPIHTQSSPHQIQRQQRNIQVSLPLYSTTAFEKELVRVVVRNNWSFRTVERPSFQRFMQFLKPDTVITSRYKFGLMFQNQFELAKESLLSDLGKATKLSIALDAWSANNHLGFLAVKGYYINDDWQLREKLLDFIPIRGSHTGVSMATEVLHILSNTNTKRRLLAITCDNAGNNSTLTSNLQSKLQDENIDWDAKENTIPCLAHIINLVVQDIIQHLKLAPSTEIETGETFQRRHVQEIQAQTSVPNSLRKLRATTFAIDRSTQRFERFIATQHCLPTAQRLSIIRDVKTRWNSTYDMCARAVQLKTYIDEWLKQEIALKSSTTSTSTSSDASTAEVDSRDLKRLRLSSTEWHHLELVTDMLQQFKNATNFVSQNEKPQIQYIWLMYNRLFDFLDKMTEDLGEDQENAEWPVIVRAAADRGRTKLSKYYGRTEAERGYLFNCATILDPTQKLTAYEDDTWEIQDKHDYREQFLQYLRRYDIEGSRDPTPAVAQPRRSQGSEWFRKPPQPVQSQSSGLSQVSMRSVSGHSQASSTHETEEDLGPTYAEGEDYLSTPCVKAADQFDILSWWKANEDTYPRLAQVAKDILAIQIAEVGVERVFNVAKDVIGDRRHHLSAQTIQKIMVLRDAITQEDGNYSAIPVGIVDESQGPADEVDDLFELPGQLEEIESVEDGDTAIESDIEEVIRQPRKRQRPQRYRD